MSKWCFNYDSGAYEEIDREGFSWTKGEYTFNWDDSEYHREEMSWQNNLNDDDFRNF